MLRWNRHRVMSTDPQGGISLRTQVIVSLVSSLLFLLIIQPLLRGGYSFLLFTRSRISDQIYQSASLGHRNFIEVIFLAGFAAFLMGSLVGSVLGGVVRETPERGQELRRWVSRLAHAVIGLAVIPVLVVTVMSFADLQLNVSFERRLTALAPVLSEQEEEVLRAQWASMMRRSDYVRINQSMEELARTRKVTLPKLLLP